MKKLLATVIFAFFPLLSFANTSFTTDKKLVCDNTSTIINELMSPDIREMVTWSGSSAGSKFALLTNKSTGTWTLIQFDKKIACVLGTGENSKMVVNRPST